MYCFIGVPAAVEFPIVFHVVLPNGSMISHECENTCFPTFKELKSTLIAIGIPEDSQYLYFNARSEILYIRSETGLNTIWGDAVQTNGGDGVLTLMIQSPSDLKAKADKVLRGEQIFGCLDQEKKVESAHFTTSSSQATADQTCELRPDDKLGDKDTTVQVDSSNVPPAWFKSYMDTLKKDIVEEVSNEVTKNITLKQDIVKEFSSEVTKILTDVLSKKESEPPASSPSIEAARSITELCPIITKYLSDRRASKQKTRTSKEGRNAGTVLNRDEKQVARNVKINAREMRSQKKLAYKNHGLGEKMRGTLKTRSGPYDILDAMNNLEEGQSTRQEDKSAVGDIFLPGTNLSISQQRFTDPAICTDDEHPMKFSIINDQLLNDCSDEQHFELIQMPTNCDANVNCVDCSIAVLEKSPNKELNLEESEKASSKESSSFELISESPTPPLSICIAEDYFSTSASLISLSQAADSNREEASALGACSVNKGETKARQTISEPDKINSSKDAKINKSRSEHDDCSRQKSTNCQNGDFQRTEPANEQATGAMEPVQILPEPVVSGAMQIASIAISVLKKL